MKDRIIAFDFDGVFSSNFNFHREHVEKFSKKEISEEDFYNLHSGNVYKNDGEGLEMEQFDAMGYCDFIEDEFRVLPMAPGMDNVIAHVEKFSDMFIVSSGCEFNIKNFLDKNNIDKNKFSIYGVETDPSKKVKFEKMITETGVDPEKIIFITDTLGDMLEAAEVGIASIGVSWGFQRIETLEQGAPFGFAHKPSDIITLVDEFFENV